jgi:hypothetical protein
VTGFLKWVLWAFRTKMRTKEPVFFHAPQENIIPFFTRSGLKALKVNSGRPFGTSGQETPKRKKTGGFSSRCGRVGQNSKY